MTDAAVVLGMLPVELAGGVGLSRDRAEAALAPLAEPPRLRVGGRRRARARCTSQRAAMADAIRGITVEQGRDPREAALVAFGGAGPLFGTLAGRRARRRHARDPGPRRQLLRLGPARRRSGPDRVAHPARRASATAPSPRSTPSRRCCSTSSRAARHARVCCARCTSTSAMSARSTRSRSRHRARRAGSPPTPPGWSALRARVCADVRALDGRGARDRHGARARAPAARAAPGAPRRTSGAPRAAAHTEAWSFARDELAAFALVARDSLRPATRSPGPRSSRRRPRRPTWMPASSPSVHPNGALIARRQRP